METTLPPNLIPANASRVSAAQSELDRASISALDIKFQRATKYNDAATIEGILHPDFMLVLGNGKKVSRHELVKEARDNVNNYEIQDEEIGTQSVSVFGDTGVVTAKLRIKGTRGGVTFDRILWFSDTYVRTPRGWQYAYAQASLPLSDD